MHLVPAGLPLPVPGIIVEIEGAMQQAPHLLHSILAVSSEHVLLKNSRH